MADGNGDGAAGSDKETNSLEASRGMQEESGGSGGQEKDDSGIVVDNNSVKPSDQETAESETNDNAEPAAEASFDEAHHSNDSDWQTAESDSSAPAMRASDPDPSDDSDDFLFNRRRRRRDSSSSEDELMDSDALNPAVDPWKPLEAIKDRELGFHNRMSGSEMFQIKAGASLNLVKRLELFTKLEGHDGCVNALHFNQNG